MKSADVLNCDFRVKKLQEQIGDVKPSDQSELIVKQ